MSFQKVSFQAHMFKGKNMENGFVAVDDEDWGHSFFISVGRHLRHYSKKHKSEFSKHWYDRCYAGMRAKNKL